MTLENMAKYGKILYKWRNYPIIYSHNHVGKTMPCLPPSRLGMVQMAMGFPSYKNGETELPGYMIWRPRVQTQSTVLKTIDTYI
jgi:hypothetical protein